MKKLSTRALVLLIALVVFFGSVLVLNNTLTDGGKVRRQSVNWITDEGVNINATLFVPANATAETPAAGVLVAPGGNTPHTFYSTYCLELARRGYVVLAYDYYGTVTSDFTTAGSSGAVAAMKYLAGLSFVDSSRLAATGHSNGGGQAFAAITSEAALAATTRTVIFIGCGISGDITMLEGVNTAAIWGKLDECGQGVFWDVVHADKLNYGDFAKMVGIDSTEVVPGNIYTAENGALRAVYIPNTFHSLSNIMPEPVENIIAFIDQTLQGNVSGLAANDFIYTAEEFAVLFMALAMCVMIFPVGSMLLDLPFFKSIKKPVPAATAKADWKFWLFLILPGIVSALLVKDTIIQGQMDIFGKAPNIFQVQSTSGFVWWFFLSAVVSVVFFVIRSFVDKSVDRGAVLARFKTTPIELGKAIIFGLGVIALPYACTVISERWVGWYGRIFQTYFASVGSNRLGQYVVYFIMFAILFTIYANLQADLRLKSGKKGADYLIALVANALPAALFLIILYGELIFTHVTPITGREMSRAQGAMMGMLLLYFVIANVVDKFFKKSGNIYIVAMANAAFVTWLSVNVQQLIV